MSIATISATVSQISCCIIMRLRSPRHSIKTSMSVKSRTILLRTIVRIQTQTSYHQKTIQYHIWGCFDGVLFLHRVKQLGIEAKLVNFDFTGKQIECAGMRSFCGADPHDVNRLLGFFKPSKKLKSSSRESLETLASET